MPVLNVRSGRLLGIFYKLLFALYMSISELRLLPLAAATSLQDTMNASAVSSEHRF